MSIRLNEERQRFELDLEGGQAFLTFRRSDGLLLLDHTEVPPQHEGGGVGGRLARHALEYARAHDLRAVPRCPFVSAWLRRHPEYADIVAARED